MGTGGEAPNAPMALVEIRISQGSNTDEEKAAFVAQAFAALQAHLGGSSPLAEASYVTVLEVPAQHWGYGG
ncbi:tautomerase family protein [Ideonella paludis]|uniref:tautomerase family protein n=1 Tax=Ideonella paludis TaxID=1233411 RepID=UPI0036419AD6